MTFRVDAIDKNLSGAAGEHLVLSRLLSKGLLASQAPRGTRKADILVNPLDGGKPILIQVKTNVTSKSENISWPMQEKHEKVIDPDLFYCFVDINGNDSRVFVVPADIVAEVVKRTHENWLSTPGSKGQQHNETKMRQIRYVPSKYADFLEQNWMDKYLENWDQFQ